MTLPNPNGKRLLSFYDEEERTNDQGLEGCPTRKVPRTEGLTDMGDISGKKFMLASLPDDIMCNILSCLDVESLLQTRCLNRSFRTLASRGSAGWSNLCQKLWADKVHILREAREHPDPMAGYRMSVEDARNRDFVKTEELIFDPETNRGTVWSFRFKESAGHDWTSWDPWYNGQPCRKMVFLEDGTIKGYLPVDDEDSDGRGGHLIDPPFSERMGNLLEPPMVLSWRYVALPLDMPARPHGSYIRLSVGGRDVPTYCVRRSPTKNWGFIMESCWGVYASFELPKHVPRTAQRRRVRLRRAQDTLGNWFNVELNVSDDSSEEADQENAPSSTSRLLIDDDTFVVTSGLQWREAFMYNFGARNLPEGEDALASFERAYAIIDP